MERLVLHARGVHNKEGEYPTYSTMVQRNSCWFKVVTTAAFNSVEFYSHRQLLNEQLILPHRMMMWQKVLSPQVIVRKLHLDPLLSFLQRCPNDKVKFNQYNHHTHMRYNHHN